MQLSNNPHSIDEFLCSEDKSLTEIQETIEQCDPKTLRALIETYLSMSFFDKHLTKDRPDVGVLKNHYEALDHATEADLKLLKEHMALDIFYSAELQMHVATTDEEFEAHKKRLNELDPMVAQMLLRIGFFKIPTPEEAEAQNLERYAQLANCDACKPITNKIRMQLQLKYGKNI